MSFNNMSKSCGISSQASYDYTEHIMPAVNRMEIDSPTASPDVGEEPASNSKGRHGMSPYDIKRGRWSSVMDAPLSSLHIASRESIGQSEGAWIAMCRQLVDSLFQQYSILTMKLDTTAKSLCEVRQGLIEMQVSRMENEADLEDIISSLKASNSALEAKLAKQKKSQQAERLEALCLRRELSSFGRNRKRTRFYGEYDLKLNRKRHRCS